MIQLVRSGYVYLLMEQRLGNLLWHQGLEREVLFCFNYSNLILRKLISIMVKRLVWLDLLHTWREVVCKTPFIPEPFITWKCYTVEHCLVGKKMCFFLFYSYEGTGRSLSLKLIQQLREQSAKLSSTSSLSQSAGKGVSSAPLGRSLYEISLNESIRYAPGDEIEKWLNHLLCLDATVVRRLSPGCPVPESCDLYPLNYM